MLRKEVALTKQQERPRLLQLLLEGLLVFVRDGLAYGYLISRMLQDPTMELGTFTVYFAAIAGFGNWLSQLVIGADALMRAHHRIGDYRAFLDIPDTTRVPDGVAVASRPGPHTIRLEHVSYTYPESDRLVLDDISLEIGAGENLALVGVNGAGKTTLVKLLCGLIRPTKGEIYVDGINIREIDREEYFKLFAAVFQDICVLPVSIAENISYAVTPQQQDEKRLIAALEAAGLQEKIAALPQGANTPLLTQFNKDGIELSGGELQKLLLARALYKDAPVLILDEPTAALDPIAENRLYLQYHTLTKGKTSVYISHRLSSTRFCDRIVLLDGAKIAESGTHEALLASDGKYAAMFALSSKYYREAEEGDTHEIA